MRSRRERKVVEAGEWQCDEEKRGECSMMNRQA